METIIIDEEFSIRKDTSFSFILAKKINKPADSRAKNPNEPSYQNSYHSSIENCLRSYVRQTVNKSDSIPDILTKIEYLDKKISELHGKT